MASGQDTAQLDEQAQLLVLGPNPCIQRTLFFDDFRPGHVNRANKALTGIGGKGQCCAAASGCLGIPTHLVQFEGDNSQILNDMIGETSSSKVTVVGTRFNGNIRQATTLLSTSAGASFIETEVVEPSPQVGECEVQAMVDSFSDTLDRLASMRPGPVAVAMMGTCPTGAERLYETVCHRITKQFRHKDTDLLEDVKRPFVLLDSYRGIDKVLASGAVDCLKVNVKELSQLVHINDPDHFDAAAIAPLVFDLLKRHNIRFAAVTDGSRPAHLFDAHANGCLKFDLSRLELKFVNAIGSGDAVAGALAWRLAKASSERELIDAFSFALAAGSAACETSTAGRVDPARVVQLEKQIEATRVSIM